MTPTTDRMEKKMIYQLSYELPPYSADDMYAEHFTTKKAMDARFAQIKIKARDVSRKKLTRDDVVDLLDRLAN